jgi:hypothetical protein
VLRQLLSSSKQQTASKLYGRVDGGGEAKATWQHGFPHAQHSAKAEQQRTQLMPKETKEKHNTTQQHCTLQHGTAQHNNTCRIREKIVLFISK